MKSLLTAFCCALVLATQAQVQMSGNVSIRFNSGYSSDQSNDAVSTWVAGFQPANLTCREVCWAPALGKFVAVSDTLGKAMTSTGGGLYTVQNCPNQSWWGLCWSPELALLVAVAGDGTGNRAMTSPNGVTWTSRATPTSPGESIWQDVVWSPQRGRFAAVGFGAGGYVMSSTNGINWAYGTTASTNHLSGVCWSPEKSLFVAVSESSSGSDVSTSSDGITWVQQTTPSPNRIWLSICWAPQIGKFVAVAGSGTGNRVMTSPDGTNWANQVSAANNQWTDIAWSPELGQLAAIADTGTGNRVMTSTNGTNWVSHSAAVPLGQERAWASIAYSPSLVWFAAVADITGVEDTTRRVMTSSSLPFTPANLRIDVITGTVTNPPPPVGNTNIWVKQYGSSGSDAGTVIAIDGTNLLIGGTFSGTMTIGSQTLTNAGGRDIFLALINTNGTPQWAKRFGSTGDEYITALFVDNAGNIYTGGYFGGSGNVGGTTTSSSGGWDFYVAKYDSTGIFVWDRKVGGTSDDVVTCITLDQYQTNVIASGHYQGTVNFTTTNLSSFDTGTDSFVVKYGTNSGTPIWVQSWLNRGYDTGVGIKVDSSGNLLLVGYIGTRIDFGNGLLTTTGGNGLNDIYLVKWAAPGASPLGTPTWSKLSGGTNGQSAYAFGLDSDNNLIVGGTFTTSANFGGSLITGTGSDTDMFLAKYSGTDGSHIWSRALLCTQGGAPRGIAFDSSKNPVVCGYFYGTCNFGGGPSLVSSSGSQDAFIAKYTSAAGAYTWAERGGGTSGEDCGGIVVDAVNYPNVVGTFSGTAGFVGVSLTSNGLGDVFLWRHTP